MEVQHPIKASKLEERNSNIKSTTTRRGQRFNQVNTRRFSSRAQRVYAFMAKALKPRLSQSVCARRLEEAIQ